MKKLLSKCAVGFVVLLALFTLAVTPVLKNGGEGLDPDIVRPL